MIAVTGASTTIVKELGLLADDHAIYPLDVDLSTFGYNDIKGLEYECCDLYVLCAGVLYPKTILEQSVNEVANNITVNLLGTMALCEAILERNDKARIVIMGSASGVKGSYDNVYAAAKAGLHQYVINKRLKPEQQLVAVAPSIICDSGMTHRRTDLNSLKRREKFSPKKRFITAKEVAQMIYYLLLIDSGFTTNTVINMTGGEVKW